MPEYCHLKTEISPIKEEQKERKANETRYVDLTPSRRSLFVLMFVTGHSQDIDLTTTPLETTNLKERACNTLNQQFSGIWLKVNSLIH